MISRAGDEGDGEMRGMGEMREMREMRGMGEIANAQCPIPK
jgi:hypothetical protein